MGKRRRQYSADYKFKIALEASKGSKTLSQLASETGVHANQISQWKGKLLDGGNSLFLRNDSHEQRELEKRETELYEQIGRLKMELEWLKKKAAQFD